MNGRDARRQALRRQLLALGAQFKDTPGYVLLDNFSGHLDFINRYLVNDADRPEFQAWLLQTFSP